EAPTSMHGRRTCARYAWRAPSHSRCARLVARRGSALQGPMAFMSDRLLSPREFLEECVGFKREQTGAGRFFMALMTGKLTRPQLLSWAKDMYHFVGAGIPALTAWLAHAPTVVERDSARLVARNLAGELGFIKEADHRDLYVQFLAGLGVSEADARE